MFAHRGADGAVHWAVTDRLGGVSRGGYAELNLGAHVGDDPRAVAANRARLAAALGLPAGALRFLRQVHGTTVYPVTGDNGAAEPVADAQYTQASRRVLAVLVADCAPVLLWDGAAGLVAAVHAGRRGLASGVVPAAVAALRAAGAQRLQAQLGPVVCAAHYEVPAAMRDEVASLVPASAASTPAGTPALDIAAGLRAQLAGLDVPARSTGDCPACDARLFSHRRDGPGSGRFAALIWRSE